MSYNFSGNSKIEIETTTLFTPYQNLTFYVILGFFFSWCHVGRHFYSVPSRTKKTSDTPVYQKYILVKNVLHWEH